MGAGPVPAGCGGILTKGINRPLDVSEDPFHLELLPIPEQYEDLFIDRFFTAFDAFSAGLPYECFPDPGTNEYNSNSFARGLMHAAQAPVPTFPNVWLSYLPGWVKPIPVTWFTP